MDDQLVAAVEDEHDGLQQSPLGVEAEPKLPRRRILVQVLNPDRPRGSLDCVLGGDPVL
jgi:hypothetical protein